MYHTSEKSAQNEDLFYGLWKFLLFSDPLIVSLAEDLFKVLSENPGCRDAVQQRLVPTLVSIMGASSDKIPVGMQSVSNKNNNNPICLHSAFFHAQIASILLSQLAAI